MTGKEIEIDNWKERNSPYLLSKRAYQRTKKTKYGYVCQSTFVSGCGMNISAVRAPGDKSTVISRGQSILGHGNTENSIN